MGDSHNRLRAALDAYPQGYTTTADLAAHLLVTVRADDLRALLGDLYAYQETMLRIAEADALQSSGASNG